MPIFLNTDASEYGIGGCLYQLGPDETGKIIERPIEFISKSLSKQQVRWSTTDKEAFAIYYCLSKLQNKLLDRKFTLQTDHASLVFINDAPSKRVMRWKLSIQEFDFDIRHIPGELNKAADSLSRIPSDVIESLEERETLMLLDAFEIPTTVSDAFQEIHNATVGHLGVDKTVTRLKEKLAEKGLKVEYLRSMVRTLIRKCPMCQKQARTKDPSKANFFHTSTTHPMTRLNIDTIGPFPKDSLGCEYILVIIDTFTRWTELYALESTTSQEAAGCLLNHVCTFGIPNQILSDNGPQFANDLIRALSRMLGVDFQTTIPYSKEENAIVERANREVNRHLEALVTERRLKQHWSAYLPLVKRILNSSVHSSTGQKPADLLYAKTVNLDKGLFVSHDDIDSDSPINIQDWLLDKMKAADIIMKVATETQTKINTQDMDKRTKRKHISKNTVAQIQIDDLVLIDRPTDEKRPKLSTQRIGPVRVVDIDRGGRQLTVQLENASGRKSIRKIRKERAHLYIQDPNSSIDPVVLASSDPENWFELESIVGYKGSLKTPCKLKFILKWKDYGSDENTTQQLDSSLRNNIIFQEWAKTHSKQEIRNLLKS
jgi:transposase InsO family protein